VTTTTVGGTAQTRLVDGVGVREKVRRSILYRRLDGIYRAQWAVSVTGFRAKSDVSSVTTPATIFANCETRYNAYRENMSGYVWPSRSTDTKLDCVRVSDGKQHRWLHMLRGLLA
jgi:hypothetical protein